VDQGLRDALERLAISPDRGRQPGPLPIPAVSPGKGKAPDLEPQQPIPHQVVDPGPPAQRTRQMQKEFDRTLLKRLEEAKAAEKKRKKETEEKRKRQKTVELFHKYKPEPK